MKGAIDQEERLATLRSTTRRALDELAEDAKRYLELLEKLRSEPEHTDAYHNLELEVDLQVANLMVHAMSTHELFDELTDALPDDDEEVHA